MPPDNTPKAAYSIDQLPIKGGQYQAPQPGRPLVQRVLIAGGLFIGVLILIVGAMSFFSGGSSNTVASVADIHLEIARVSEIAMDAERADADTKNFAAVVRSSALSNVATLTSIAQTNGQPIDIKSLSEYHNPDYDAQLEKANDTDTVGSAYKNIIAELIDQANRLIAKASEEEDKEIIDTLYVEMFESNETLVPSSS